jgi:penicillin-binding protein 1C
MRALHGGGPARAAVASLPPPAPSSIVARQVRFEPALEPSRREYFVRGTERDIIALAATGENASTRARIAYPLPGTIVALDPDIPPRHQRMQFTATTAHPEARWELDGTPQASAARPLAWMPLPGRHRLRLVERGKVLDEVQFEVRGAQMKPGAGGGTLAQRSVAAP